jgi:hypothetical protein
MENNPLSVTQVLAITNIEYLITIFYNDPENTLNKIMILIDEHKIAEHDETMMYFYELLAGKAYLEHAEAFAKKYNIQTEKT